MLLLSVTERHCVRHCSKELGWMTSAHLRDVITFGGNNLVPRVFVPCGLKTLVKGNEDYGNEIAGANNVRSAQTWNANWATREEAKLHLLLMPWKMTISTTGGVFFSQRNAEEYKQTCRYRGKYLVIPVWYADYLSPGRYPSNDHPQKRWNVKCEDIADCCIQLASCMATWSFQAKGKLFEKKKKPKKQLIVRPYIGNQKHCYSILLISLMWN